MKNAIKALAACVAVMLSCTVWAKTYTQSAYTNGRQWWYYLDEFGNAIIEHENSSSTYTAAIPTSASGSIIIPSKLDGHPVVGIGSKAFYYCDKITKVTIQEGVTDIDFAAFYNCHQLAEVNLPSSLKTIGMYAFGYCIGLEDINFTVPGTMEKIYAYAFTHCWALESVTLPQTVTTIGAYAFENCKVLDAIAIPAAVTVLRDNAFKDCEALEKVTLPASLVAADIKTRCFSGCPDDLVIASAATVGGLTWNFRIVNGGAEICWDDENDEPTIPDTTSSPVDIPGTLGGLPVTSIGEGAFSGCDQLPRVTIPASVTSIGEWAFEDCKKMVLTVPDTVTTIGDAAFQGCDAMADANGFVIVQGVLHHYNDKDDDVTIPEGVTRIGSCAFFRCDIESVVIPASVTSIGSSAFVGCKYLEAIDIPASVTSIGGRAFYECDSLADKDGFVIVRDVLYYYTKDAATVTIPGGVTEISEGAFYDNDDIESVVIPASVTSIGASAFFICDRLTVATIPSSVTSIGTAAFADGSLNVLLTKVHVEAGDIDRVKSLLTSSRHKNVSGITFVEDVPAPCRVFFDPNGGSVSPAMRLVTKGAALGLLPEATRAGWTLLGWFTLPEGGEEVTSATVVTGDATYYARWSEITAYTWFTTKAAAFAEAKKTGKKVFMICGRDTCWNTMTTKNVSCEEPGVKAKLVAKCVLWYSNCDTQEDENRAYYPGGSFTLPLVCIIDPTNNKVLVRSTGYLTGAQILALLEPIPYPSVVQDPDELDPFYPGDLPGYQVLNPANIWDPLRASKAMTMMGAAYYGNDVAGVVELKVGKLKNWQANVSGSVTLLNGKKYTIKSQKCDFDDKLASTLNLDVKGLGRMRIAIGSIGGANVFSGSLSKWHVQSANVGGSWSRPKATATVEVGDLSVFAGTVFDDLLPTNEVASVVRGKWTFAKAASVKWGKPKAGDVPRMYDVVSGKGLIVDTAKGKTNLSGLKLTYTLKKGTFKGSFKVYAMQYGKLKKFTISVNGVVVDGVGRGNATSKRPAVSWPVTVK